MFNLVLFEDERYSKLLPLVHTRPVWELRCGISTLLEKIQRNYPIAPLHFALRPHLADVVGERSRGGTIGRLRNGNKALFVNGRILASPDMWKLIPPDGPDEIFTVQGWVGAARLSGPSLQLISEKMGDILDARIWDAIRNKVAKSSDVQVKLVGYLWDLVRENPAEIVADFRAFGGGGKRKGYVHPHADLYEEKQIVVGEGSQVMAQVVIDARSGPVYIGKNVEILPHTRIEGPVYIGDRTRILGGKIRTGSSIGEECRVGGEVEDAILHAHTNKQHDGFLGHAYVGEWVNLGAGTTNSDLKNNYGPVKVWNDGAFLDTGEMFVGCFIGDHSKTGIGTLINTGTIIGVAANFFGGGVTPKFVPSFAWGGSGGLAEHRIEDAIGTARIVMGRRKVEMTPAMESLLKNVFEQTVLERSPQTAPLLTR